MTTDPQAPEIAALAERNSRMSRGIYDGEPYYCQLCGAGGGEFFACEMPDCKLESKASAEKRAEDHQRLMDHAEVASTPLPIAPQETMRGILKRTLGKTGYTFLASRISEEPNFGAVMMEALQEAYALGQSQIIKLKGGTQWSIKPTETTEPNWARCPSTHCERRQECASPRDCIVRPPQPPATVERELAEALVKYIDGRKADTDGPQRDDWQRGYAAACREIREHVKALATAAVERPWPGFHPDDNPPASQPVTAAKCKRCAGTGGLADDSTGMIQMVACDVCGGSGQSSQPVDVEGRK